MSIKVAVPSDDGELISQHFGFELFDEPVIDNRPLEARSDVLTYTTAPLPQTMEAIGRAGNLLDPTVTVKIPRSAVYRILLRSSLGAWSNAALSLQVRARARRVAALLADKGKREFRVRT